MVCVQAGALVKVLRSLRLQRLCRKRAHNVLESSENQRPFIRNPNGPTAAQHGPLINRYFGFLGFLGFLGLGLVKIEYSFVFVSMKLSRGH